VKSLEAAKRDIGTVVRCPGSSRSWTQHTEWIMLTILC